VILNREETATTSTPPMVERGKKKDQEEPTSHVLAGGTEKGKEMAGAIPNAMALLEGILTAVPVKIDPHMLASGNEAIFEGPEIEGTRRRRRRQTQRAGRKDLLGSDADHKALVKEAARDRGRGAQADPRQALQERDTAPKLAAKAP
jgi:hypothetical protein